MPFEVFHYMRSANDPIFFRPSASIIVLWLQDQTIGRRPVADLREIAARLFPVCDKSGKATALGTAASHAAPDPVATRALNKTLTVLGPATSDTLRTLIQELHHNAVASDAAQCTGPIGDCRNVVIYDSSATADFDETAVSTREAGTSDEAQGTLIKDTLIKFLSTRPRNGF